MAKPGEFNQTWLLPTLLVVLAVLVILLTILSPSQPGNSEPLTDRSIYNSAPTGYRAWYLTSKKAGLPLLTWEKSFSHLNELPSPATMLIVEPYTVNKDSILFGEKEVSSLMAWVKQGNTLVLLDNFKRYGSSYVTEALKLHLEPVSSARSNYVPGKPMALTAPEKNILASYVHRPLLSESGLAFQLEYGTLMTPSEQETLLKNPQGQPMIFRMPYGKGALILGTTGDIGANRFLNEPANDNYQFLTNMLIREQKPVYINEFIHGYVEAGDLLSYYQRQTPLGPIFGQLILAFIVLLWLSFVRWTPRPVEAADSLSSESGSGLETYMQSLAGIYLRTNASPLAVTPLLNRLESLLRRKYRLSLTENGVQSPEDEARLGDLLGTVFGAYSNKDEAAISPQSALDALRNAHTVSRKRQRLQPRELLRLVQQLTTIEERLQQYGQRHPASRR